MHADPFELSPPEERDVWRQREPNRDPRRKPQPGDVFAVGADVREVLQCWHGRIEYGFPGKAATRSMPRILWDAWARNADVQKVAA